MKKHSPDFERNSLNEKPALSSGQADDKFGGRHGGRENIQSKAGEENLLKQGGQKKENPERQIRP